MKRVFFAVIACLILFGCNGAKKQAAYECSDYLKQAYEAFDDGDYQVLQARRAPDWSSMRNYLQKAISYFDDAEKYSKKAADIASDYDSDVESYAKKAMSSADDARQHAKKAYSSTEDYYVDTETNRSKSSASDGMSLIKKAQDNLWY